MKFATFTRTRFDLLLLLILLAAILFIASNWSSLQSLSLSACAAIVSDRFCESSTGYAFWRFVTFPLLILPLILAAEQIRPAVQDQRLLSGSLATDLVWLFITPVVLLLMIRPMQSFFASISVNQAVEAGFVHTNWWNILIAILISDFLIWGSHYIVHKVPFLWELHKVHHSQKALNCMSTFRVHPLDRVVTALLMALPFFFLPKEISLIALAGWVFFRRFHNMIVHSNLRSNFGLLGYIFVSPQYHRIHHSTNRAQYDKNFGETFVFWDKIFGTFCRSADYYPTTGVRDIDFPLEPARPSLRCIAMPIAQTIYPLGVLIRTSAVGVRRIAKALFR